MDTFIVSVASLYPIREAMTATGIPCIRVAQAWRTATSLVAHHLLPRTAVGAEREPLDSLGFPRTFQHRREPIG